MSENTSKELELYLERIENTVVMRVIKQEGINDCLSCNIKVDCCPDLYKNEIFLRGASTVDNHITCCIKFDTEQQAGEYLQKVIGWFDDVFYKEVEPKRGDEVFVSTHDEEPEKRIFITKIEGALEPIICVNKNDEERFKNGEKFHISAWERIVSSNQSGYNPETKTYRGVVE